MKTIRSFGPYKLFEDDSGFHLSGDSQFSHSLFNGRYKRIMDITDEVLADFLLISDEDAVHVARGLLVKSKRTGRNGYVEMPVKVVLQRR
jgi:TPP-dependent 2-oxoacid decarboxylase